MEKINLNVVIEQIKKFEARQITADEFEEFAGGIYVYNYIPLINKVSLIADLTFYRTLFEGNLPEVLMGELEKIKLFGLLFAYTNIDVSVEQNTFENYDIIMKSSITDGILEICQKDYFKLEKMFDSFISVSNLLYIGSALKTINPEAMEAERVSMQELMKHLDKDTVDKLANIFTGSDPGVMEALKELKTKAIAEIMAENK